MPDQTALIKANPLLPAEDYEALRKQGFRAIERLGSSIWTDYNNSDPGITMLEAVCYAITDLAYRTGFDVKDLLTPELLTEDTWKNIFYTARNILHNNPLTISDYRKLIIDVKGVRNAWLEPSKDYEVPVWIDYNYYQQKKEADCGCKDKELKGCYGKLGLEPVSQADVVARNTQRLLEIETELTQHTESILLLEAKIAEAEEKLKVVGKDLIAKMNLENEIKKLKAKKEKLEQDNKLLEEEKKVIANQEYIQPKIVELEGLYNVMVEYEENIINDEGRREEVRQQVVDRLSMHRNLCEDFLSVNAVEYLDFGIGVSAVLEEYADPDAILAEIFFRIYKYFTPAVAFHTIDQMMAKGYSIDEIFEGPALQHGFIETSQLEKTDLFRDVRLSDLISEVADIKGIKAITYLHIPFKGFENMNVSALVYFSEWVELLREEKKLARIDSSLSSALFCKEHEVITYNTGRPKQDRDMRRMLKMFEAAKKQERNYKLEGHKKDLPVPAGEYMDLQDYYPVTYSLPMCYGVSERAGLPLYADDKRKVQALQLKGYLLFFEQLLAGYLVQLDHLRDLFSFDDPEKKTYFTRALTEINELQALLIDHADRGADHFDQILNDFTSVLQNIVEPSAVFHKRRNDFLDHLLARFSENLNEYEAISRWLTPGHAEERLIKDKERILKNGEYWKISSDRGKAYNYSDPLVWNTGNVSGAERRISRLLGFENADRRSLAPEYIITEPVMIIDDKTKTPVRKKNKKDKPLNVIKFYDPDNKDKVILTSVEVVEGCCTEELLNEIFIHADDRRYFRFYDELKQKSRKSAGVIGSFWFELWDGTDADTASVLATGEKYESKTARDDAFETLQKMMDCINKEEGLHLVEHLLFRPKFDLVLDENNNLTPVTFPDICLDPCDLGRGTDPRIDPPKYRKRITRIPAEKCYNNMPWILEFLEWNADTNAYDRSILFKETYANGDNPVLLTFRHYSSLAKRVKDLYEFGSERINYTVDDNREWVEDPTDADSIKYRFTIHDDRGRILAQSLYIYNKRTRKQIGDGVQVTDDIERAIEALMNYFEFELDLYCDPDPCDHNEDPFSFRCTIVLPCWPKRLRDATFRKLVEKTIQTETPAHVHTTIKWIGIAEMKDFEKVYFDWLREMAQTEMPAYEYVNPLVDTLNTLVPCGCCHDECNDGEKNTAKDK